MTTQTDVPWDHSMKVAAWDKLLPNQPMTANQYDGAPPLERTLYETIIRTCDIPPPATAFKIEQTDMFTIEEMASSPVALNFLTWLLRLINAKRVLEVGSFVGVSAMHFATALPADGRVVTIEKFDHFAAIARRNFQANALADKIELIEGDALAVLPTLGASGPFDMAFIDGSKERYADYFRLIAPMMAPRGIVIVDDAFFHGDAVNTKPKTEKGRGVRAFLDLAATCGDWHRAALPICNGMFLMYRR